MSETILLIDDDQKMQSIVTEVLGFEGFAVVSAFNGTEALSLLESNKVSVILLDLILPDINGLELLDKIIERNPNIPIIIITSYGTIDKAVSAIKKGAYDFLEKPLEPQRVILTIKNAIEKNKLVALQQVLIEEMMRNNEMIGENRELQKVCASASRIAKFDTPVLICGENGTGKELLASLIHKLSGRSNFVCVNCAAIPQELIESELFGHTKGAFTGAITEKNGKFQMADGGTIFLDEIGDMSPFLQAKILRALEIKEICKVGATENQKINTRFITATNKDLTEEIRRGKFREDLYYRLLGVKLFLPPLRDRLEDIPLLSQHFLSAYCKKNNLEEKHFTPRAIEILKGQQWKGNIRELKHFVENLTIFSTHKTIDHLEVLSLLHSLSNDVIVNLQDIPTHSFKKITETYEKTLILKVLQETHNNISHAAEILHIGRSTLSKKIKKIGLRK